MFALAALCASQALAQGKEPWQEYSKYIQNAQTFTALGPDLFGDRVNPADNTLSFSVTDISLPGNNALPVQLTRTMRVFDRHAFDSMDLPMADWDLDLPSISGTFSAQYGWPNRCKPIILSGRPFPPIPNTAVVTGGTAYPTEEFWQGNSANMPGGGELLWSSQAATPKPATGPSAYYWMTNQYTYFSCLDTIKNGSGDGFLAVTADGTKYWFDWMATYTQPALNSPKTATPDASPLYRVKIALYATRVEDRFGNWVAYTYTNASNARAKLTQIESSDGRMIKLTYNAGNAVATATATAKVPTSTARQWTYTYDASVQTLTGVKLPDNTSWTLDFAGLTGAQIDWDGQPPRTCGAFSPFLGGGGSGTATHPSGAVGTFVVAPKRFGRTNVPQFCINWEYPINDRTNDLPVFPRSYEVLSITSKTISGPGLAAQTWSYSGGNLGSWLPDVGPKCDSDDCAEPVCMSDACAGTYSTEVSGPGTWVRYTFGSSYRYNEGKLLKIERGPSQGVVLETESPSYRLPTAHYPPIVATSLQYYQGGFDAETPRPESGRSIVRDGATFASTVTAFDAFNRPTAVTRASSLGYSKAETTEFLDMTNKASYPGVTFDWLVGLVKRTTTNGIEVESTTYDPVSFQPETSKSFGAVQQTLDHNADGTIKTVTDGNGKVTGLSNWFRGVPRLVTRPDLATQSAVVNDFGWLTQVTDEVNATTKYQYDAMGRISLIDYVDADAVNWTNTTRTLVPVANGELGLGAGHWKETVATGNGRTTTYYDARWQPVVKLTEVVGNAASKTYLVKRFDADGRVVFESYPVPTLTAYSDTLEGNTTSYDGLGRVTRVEQDSELGKLVTTTEYLPGFVTRVTNPRGFKTTTSFQSFDKPSSDAPVQVLSAEGAPEQQRTVIARDAFGKPISVTRSGPGG